MTQAQIGKILGVSKARVSQYEAGDGEPDAAAGRLLIAAAAERGHVITFDDIFGQPATSNRAAAFSKPAAVRSTARPQRRRCADASPPPEVRQSTLAFTSEPVTPGVAFPNRRKGQI